MKTPSYSIQDRVRQLLREQGSVPGDVDSLTPEADLYAAGLTSLASVDMILALEQTFDVVLPDSALNRRTFQSIKSIAAVVERLQSGATS
jgi:acyl carrier protein